MYFTLKIIPQWLDALPALTVPSIPGPPYIRLPKDIPR